MKKITTIILLLFLVGFLIQTLDAEIIEGAGASFPKPVYHKWMHKYYELTGVKINYQSIGSGGGIANIEAKKVDFGASDKPLKKDELDESGLIQFPMVMGGVVPIINLEGLEPGSLKLTSALLVDIFQGKIKKWNDINIQKINSDLHLPKLDITVVHRADGSGTTWIFTNYLDKVSPEWHEKVGYGKTVKWPAGIGGKGNEGVASNVMQIEGAIGYVEFAYAHENQIPYASLQNQSGNFVKPKIESFQSAAANADWSNAPGFYIVLTDQPGAESWPITGATFILIHKEQSKKDVASEALKFFDWCYKYGDKTAIDLNYVPIPDNVVKLVQEVWTKDVTCMGVKLWK